MIELIAKESMAGQLVIYGSLAVFALYLMFKFLSACSAVDKNNKVTPKVDQAKGSLIPLFSISTIFILTGMALGLMG